MTLSDIRERMLEEARFASGMNVRDHTDGFLDLVAGDIETPATRSAMLGMSSCALTVRGLWRRLGLSHHILLSPYEIGAAVRDVIRIAKDLDAWREPRLGWDDHANGLLQPKPGDSAVVWSRDNGTDAHVFTIVDLEELPGMLRIESVDGGQRTADGVRCIATRRRTWARGPNGYQDRPDGGEAKAVQGWVDLDALFGIVC